MLSWIIQTTIISLILIFLVHHLINFFKSTLTVPKIKDLVNTPLQKYENIYNIINNNHKNNDTEYKNITNNKINDYSLIDLLPKNDESNINYELNLKPELNMNNELNLKPELNMKNELKNFLKSQLKNSNTNNIDVLDANSNINSYSNY